MVLSFQHSPACTGHLGLETTHSTVLVLCLKSDPGTSLESPLIVVNDTKSPRGHEARHPNKSFFIACFLESVLWGFLD